MPGPEGGVSRQALRLAAVVARLYHVHHVPQREIGTRLGISQGHVSRVLRQAEELGLVRTVVSVPEGLHPGVEEAVEARFSVREVHVVDVPVGEDLATVLGRAAARHLGDSLAGVRTVGFTSWSTTLQAMAFAMLEPPRPITGHVVEMLGDLGSPAVQHTAARSTQAMAAALGATPVFLRTPAVAATTALRLAAGRDVHVQRALALLDDLDVALVGVGPPDLHSHLRPGNGYFTSEELAGLRDAGAVVQLNQRFLDYGGRPLWTPLDDRVMAVSLAQLASAGRRVVVAGGPDKHAAIAAAVRGGWVDVLVTDSATASFLIAPGVVVSDADAR